MDKQTLQDHVRDHGRDCGGITALIMEKQKIQKTEPVKTAKKVKTSAKKNFVKVSKKSGREYFKSKGDKTISDVRDFVENEGWKLDRFPNNSRKFMLTNSNSEQFVFNWVTPVHLLYKQLVSDGISEFLKDKAKQPKSGNIPKLKSERVTKKSIREKKKIDNTRTEELELKKTEVAVKLLNTALKRGSEEHKKLRAELHAIVNELKELGAYKGFRETTISSEDMELARKRGEAIKKEKKASKGKGEKLKKIKIETE